MQLCDPILAENAISEHLAILYKFSGWHTPVAILQLVQINPFANILPHQNFPTYGIWLQL